MLSSIFEPLLQELHIPSYFKKLLFSYFVQYLIDALNWLKLKENCSNYKEHIQYFLNVLWKPEIFKTKDNFKKNYIPG